MPGRSRNDLNAKKNRGATMRTRFAVSCLAAATALVAGTMPSQAQPVLTLSGPANSTARWGSDVAVGVSYSGPCTTGIDMSLLTFGADASPGYLATSAVPTTVGCAGGRYQGTATLHLAWA